MQSVDRRLVIRAVEMVGECTRRVKQPHAEAFAAAVRLHNEGVAAEALAGRFDEQLLPRNDDGIRSADANRFEGSILARLADLEIEGAAAIDDAAAMPFEPTQHGSGQFGGVAVVARVRGGAHPVVEDALGRRTRQIKDAAVEEPIAPGKSLAIQRSRQWFEPGSVLVDHMDVRHELLLATNQR